MATKLSKPVVREVEISDAVGVTGPVVLTINEKGIEFRGKGKQRKLFIAYKDMKPVLPPNAPAKYTANPFGWLVEGANDKKDDDTPADNAG